VIFVTFVIVHQAWSNITQHHHHHHQQLLTHPSSSDPEFLTLTDPIGVGVFDGVGGWAKHGVDPRVYAQVPNNKT